MIQELLMMVALNSQPALAAENDPCARAAEMSVTRAEMRVSEEDPSFRFEGVIPAVPSRERPGWYEVRSYYMSNQTHCLRDYIVKTKLDQATLMCKVTRRKLTGFSNCME